MRSVYLPLYRGVAQSGSAPALGAGGRWFESTRPDQIIPYFQSENDMTTVIRKQ